MSASHTLVFADYAGPVIGALLFVLIMSRVPEPARVISTRSSLLELAAPTSAEDSGSGSWLTRSWQHQSSMRAFDRTDSSELHG